MRHLIVIILALCVASCATKELNSLQLQQKLDRLDNGVISGQQNAGAAVGEYKKLADKYPNDPVVVAAYADALRRAGKAREAADFLRPIVKDQTAQAMAEPVFLAYMRLLLEQHYFYDVEMRIKQRMADIQWPDAEIHNLLGVALAGQGKRAEAEEAFKKALVSWKGRPGVVEENLLKLRQAK